MVPGSEERALSLDHLNKGSRERLEHWAGSGPRGPKGDGDANADPTISESSKSHQSHAATGDDFFNLIRPRPSRNVDDDGFSDDDESEDYEDRALEVFGGLMEQHEANHSSSLESEQELARDVGSEEYHAADELNGIQPEDDWTIEQKKDTLEVERNRMETELVQNALQKGVPVQGKHFYQVANDALQEPRQCFSGALHCHCFLLFSVCLFFFSFCILEKNGNHKSTCLGPTTGFARIASLMYHHSSFYFEFGHNKSLIAVAVVGSFNGSGSGSIVATMMWKQYNSYLLTLKIRGSRGLQEGAIRKCIICCTCSSVRAVRPLGSSTKYKHTSRHANADRHGKGSKMNTFSRNWKFH